MIVLLARKALVKKGNKMIIWKSEITDEMVANLSDDDIQQLINNLDDAVQEIAESYEVGN